ncbi:MAG: FkbM family methyltransferase, partial [Chthoniobacteraceae bacterium]
MLPVFNAIKRRLEKFTGTRLYRNSLPHGMDLCRDLSRKFSLDDFKVVFDVGANEGQTIASFQKSFPRAAIHAFEPVSKLFDRIRANVSLAPSTHVHQLALGDAPGKAMINVRDDQTSSLIEGPEELHKHREEVDVTTLDAFVKQFQVPMINYLKIDSEGYDLNVLKGSKGMLEAEKIDFIQVEAGFSP